MHRWAPATATSPPVIRSTARITTANTGSRYAVSAALFGRLCLEINQAGLSWLTILRKREAFRRAFDGFDPEIVARYAPRERRRVLSDPGSYATG